MWSRGYRMWSKEIFSKTWQKRDVTWQIKHLIFPLPQGLRTPNFAGCLLIMRGLQNVTWHFNSVVIWQFENVMFPQPQGLRPPDSAGCTWLRGHLAQSQMTLLFRWHVTKTSLLLLSLLSHGLWSVILPKDERTSLKNLQFTWQFYHLTNWKRYA